MVKLGKNAKGTNVFIWIAVGLLVVYFANLGGFKDTVNGWNLFGPGTSTTPPQSGVDEGTTEFCPTDGTTTYTVNVQDALTSTATDVNTEYFVYNGNKLITSGTVAGNGQFNVACGKDYKLVLLNTTTTTGAYAKTIDLQARISDDTVNEKLIRFGTSGILSIQNPNDPNRLANTSIGAGQTKNFDLIFVSNTTDRGYNKPIILCEANTTSIQEIKIASFSDSSVSPVKVSSPKRISATASETQYAYEYPILLTDDMGTVTARGVIQATSVAPATTNDMSCRLVDQATWKTANFKTATSVEAAFPTGPENTESLADVGAADSGVVSMTFVHGGGY